MRRRRERYKAPDGLDWRDENMPVYLDTNRGALLVNPRAAQQIFQRRMVLQEHFMNARNFPHYKNDPAYDWGKK